MLRRAMLYRSRFASQDECNKIGTHLLDYSGMTKQGCHKLGPVRVMNIVRLDVVSVAPMFSHLIVRLMMTKQGATDTTKRAFRSTPREVQRLRRQLTIVCSLT